MSQSPTLPAEFTAFKAYDVRGQLGTNLDADIARAIAHGFAVARQARTVVVGRDCRASSTELAASVVEGLRDGGANVIDLGLCGTEEVYFGTDHFEADGGLCITASHNPIDYNGIKLVGPGSTPLSPDDLAAVKAAAEAGPAVAATRGSVQAGDCRAAFVTRVLSFISPADLAPLKVLVNPGNGTAGPTFDAIADGLAAAGSKVEFIRINHDPDGTFPNGIPNPMLLENQPMTGDAVVAHGCDLGLAWDGDFDRCFFFDADGQFVPGEYLVGLLGAAALAKTPGARIIHDPRVTWNTKDLVAQAGGQAVQARTGHAFIKAAMRDQDAVYGGEMSAHHYFRDFMYCDSGMIPAVLVMAHMSETGRSMADLVAARRAAFPSSGEINFKIADAKAAMDAVIAAYEADAILRDDTDGTSLEFPQWRFNLRRSNTEPLVRLNVETRGDTDLLARKVAEISAMLA